VLKRYPHRQNEVLQAWDAADELMLEHLKGESLAGKRILILNDQFGALSCGLQEYEITTYTDSFVSDQGIRINSSMKVSPIHQFRDFSGVYDLVLIKLPKNLSFFEDSLASLTSHLHPDSKIISTCMVKHMAKGHFDLIEKYIGKTTTSLAQKKARLIFAKFEMQKVESPYPLRVKIEGFEKEFTHGSNLFSREKLDIGTRFFLEHLPKGEFKTILDLGCANGVVGIRAQELNPTAELVFSDDSAMAIESARANYTTHFDREARFLWTNCFEKQEKESLDLVLCNPPFHQQNTVGDFIAEQMFLDSRSALRKGGFIRVIGNSHLGYPQMLKKIFSNSKVVATNPKFVIVDAVKN
jgi:16S rRNA G1207 methylase RsmC